VPPCAQYGEARWVRVDPGSSPGRPRVWCGQPPWRETPAMIEHEVEVETTDGKMTTFVFHPEHGGPNPVALYMMDGPGIRPALKDMAERLAAAGYYVMLPFLFYRGMTYADYLQATLDMEARRPLMQGIDNTNVVDDARALLAVADDDRAARAGSVG